MLSISRSAIPLDLEDKSSATLGNEPVKKGQNAIISYSLKSTSTLLWNRK